MTEQMTKPLPPVTEIANLPLSLQKIAKALEHKHELSPAEMRKLVMSAGVTEEDITPWADFDHPVEDSYGRKMIYKAPHFEMMVMSWRKGNFAAIHDHGHTQWGAVQVFGPAEHATFAVEHGKMYTSSRFLFEPGDVVGVSHELIHQMGNSVSEEPFLTLHVYGQEEEIDSITGDARVYELKDRQIQRVDGGVFFALPAEQVKRTEACPEPDFPTRLRHLVELCLRLEKMMDADIDGSQEQYEEALQALYAPEQRQAFEGSLQQLKALEGTKRGEVFGKILKWELEEAANLEENLQESIDEGVSYVAMLENLNK